MRAKTRQILCIALLPFLLAGSVASLDALVLCTVDGYGVAVEVAHSARAVCPPTESHGCCHAEGPYEEIKHDHVTCSDVPLRLNQGDVRDRRPVVALVVESFVMENVEQITSESTVCLPGHYSSLEHLKSVVLLV